ncbi:predicted protein [Sclerotinia sclerotiorum 1980 UF-70]|uniref:Uncharacterized protein n=1 Tax=Sclerotinia sclerotiorum (strain ATCC 18683 / 1980 / Ss-1) TaxID=665079 RepID=A7EJL8_SCLS1|nr:predicted protein [Sclerotinia sclerotiorum 1980 UF-70]EDO03034.1 predicted protein [Sclerotinia sclerotiorum 1980 UF-70]
MKTSSQGPIFEVLFLLSSPLSPCFRYALGHHWRGIEYSKVSNLLYQSVSNHGLGTTEYPMLTTAFGARD